MLFPSLVESDLELVLSSLFFYFSQAFGFLSFSGSVTNFHAVDLCFFAPPPTRCRTYHQHSACWLFPYLTIRLCSLRPGLQCHLSHNLHWCKCPQADDTHTHTHTHTHPTHTHTRLVSFTSSGNLDFLLQGGNSRGHLMLSA